MATIGISECVDFLHFQEILKSMRKLDDKIVYTMNTLPTESFQNERDCSKTCKEIFDQLQSNYKERENAIQKCIKYTTQRVNELKDKKESDSNNSSIVKDLMVENGKLKLLKRELGVEEIVQDKTNRVYYERCRSYYVPPNIPL